MGMPHLVSRWIPVPYFQIEGEEPEEPVAPRKAPRIMYHSTTNTTVMHFNNRLAAGAIDIRRCLVIVDKIQGVHKFSKHCQHRF